MKTSSANYTHAEKQMIKLYEKSHPSKSILKIAKHFLLYNWSLSIICILMLIFASTFSKHFEYKNFSSSEIVTSIGLSFLVNTITYVFIIGLSSASSTFFIRRISKKKHSTHDNWFGTLLINMVIMNIFLMIFVGFVGVYVVKLQNNRLPENYVRVVHSILYCFAIGIPFITIVIVYVSHLASEGKAWLYTLCAIVPILSFVIFSWSFFELNVFSKIHDPGEQISYLLGISFDGSFAVTGVILIFIGKYYKNKQKTYFNFSILNFRNFDFHYSKELFLNGAPVFFRTASIIIGIIVINILLKYIPIPSNSGNVTVLPNNAVYWQYVTSVLSTIATLVWRGMYAIGGGSTRYILSYNLLKKNHKQLKLTLKWSFIYTTLYLLLCEILLIALAKQILQIFGIQNGAHYYFLIHGQLHNFIAYHILNQGVIITYFLFGSIIIVGIQPLIGSYALSTKNKQLAYFTFSLDKLVLEVPFFILFTYIAVKADTYYLAWISYLISDFLASFTLAFFFYKIIKKLNKWIKIYNEQHKGKLIPLSQ